MSGITDLLDAWKGFLFYRPTLFGLTIEEGIQQHTAVIQEIALSEASRPLCSPMSFCNIANFTAFQTVTPSSLIDQNDTITAVLFGLRDDK